MTVNGRTHFGWDLTDISVIMVELSVLFAAASIRSTEPHRFQFPFEALDFRSEGLNMIFVLHTLRGFSSVATTLSFAWFTFSAK
jgi:hypothetical protein